MFNHNLTAFVSAIDSGSFTKAADKLFVTPTAVMKQINSLESHLGLKLIERTSQGVRLTPAGLLKRETSFIGMQNFCLTSQDAPLKTRNRRQMYMTKHSALEPPYCTRRKRLWTYGTKSAVSFPITNCI